jgi:hypothetical protein
VTFETCCKYPSDFKPVEKKSKVISDSAMNILFQKVKTMKNQNQWKREEKKKTEILKSTKNQSSTLDRIPQ